MSGIKGKQKALTTELRKQEYLQSKMIHSKIHYPRTQRKLTHKMVKDLLL